MTAHPVCVLLAGMLGTAELWAGQVEAVAEVAGPPVHVPLVGSTVDAMAADVLAIPHERLVLVGHSLGGIVAMATARTAPHRVAGLALLSTNPCPPRPDQRVLWEDLRCSAATGRFAEVTRRLLPGVLSPRHLADPRLVDAVQQMADRTGPAILARQLAAQQSRIDERPGLRRVTCPTLVVAATEDGLCPVDTHRDMAALVPGSRLEILDDCGHSSPLEQPSRVADLLHDWLGTPGRQHPRSAPVTAATT